MKRRTKIVCTLGPAVDSKEQIKALIDAGMNVARINCSHGDWETRKRWIQWVREQCGDIAPVAILVDLQGPKFRIGDIQGGELEVHAGQSLTLGPGPETTIPVTQAEILAVISNGSRVLLGDGNVELRVGAEQGRNFKAKAVTGGLIKSRQGFTVVGKVFDTPSLTKKDRADIEEALNIGVDFIALSYVQEAQDIRDLREIVDRKDPSVCLCAKIETRDAIRNLDDIMKVADMAMVARGDMGLQMDIEEVPIAQKRIIELCTRIGRPVITATQMLESMVHNPRPTRAEATDIANAILDGTDALMLSGETAAGEYPIECVKTMARIAERVEGMFDRTRIERDFANRAASTVSQTEAVAHAVVDLATTLRADAIVTTTTSGQTARLVSKFRPKMPIYCLNWDERTQRQMAVIWGVQAIFHELPHTTDEGIELAIDGFYRRKRLKSGDVVVVTAGVPAGKPGHTNLIFTQVV